MSPNEIISWDEDITKYRRWLLLSAETYRPERLFDVVPSPRWYDGIASPEGNYLYSNRILTAGTPLDLSMSPSRRGTVDFDGDVVIPTLFDLTGPYPDPWMSITPKEIITQRPGVRRAHGTVLVGGLGLGWFLRKVHDKPEVDRVVLVEACRELLDWYGHNLCDRLPKVTDVICGDVYDQIGRFGPKAKHLLDIWKDHGECLFDERFLRCKRLFKHVWGWGEEVADSGRLPAHRCSRRALTCRR
jgi:hypothetical protein